MRTVASNAPDQLDGQVPQDPGQSGHVVTGIRHDDDVRLARLPLARRDEPFDDVTELGGCHRGGVVDRAEPDCVQDLGPGRGAHLQNRDKRIRPAGDELRGSLRSAVDVAEEPVRRARRVRSQPRRDIHRQHQPPVQKAGQRKLGQQRAQPVGVDPTLVEAVVHRPVPTPVLRQERQLHRRVHRTRRTQHRIRQLEQLVAPHGQTPIQVVPKA